MDFVPFERATIVSERQRPVYITDDGLYSINDLHLQVINGQSRHKTLLRISQPISRCTPKDQVRHCALIGCESQSQLRTLQSTPS